MLVLHKRGLGLREGVLSVLDKKALNRLLVYFMEAKGSEWADFDMKVCAHN